jgi:putative RecB family exonuclease
MNGNGISLDRLSRILEADWYAQKVDQEIRYKNGETEMKLLVMAKELLGQYTSLPFKEIMGTDIPFTIPLVNPVSGETLGINLEGYIDLMEKDETIVEFKTSIQAMDQKDVDDHLQLTAYSYAFEMLHQRPPKLLRIVNLVKNKKQKINPFETRRDQSDYQRFFCLAEQVLKGIESKIFFPKAGFMCKDCEYGEPCRLAGVMRRIKMDKTLTIREVKDWLEERQTHLYDRVHPSSAVHFLSFKEVEIDGQPYPLTRPAQRLFAQKLQVPIDYLLRCPEGLQQTNLNHWIRSLGETPLFVRFEREKVRAGARVDRVVIMKLTGHKTLSMFTRYNTVDQADAKEAMQRLDDYFNHESADCCNSAASIKKGPGDFS